jgi:WD40 repeat protein
MISHPRLLALLTLLATAGLVSAQMRTGPAVGESARPPEEKLPEGKLPDGARLRLGSSKFREANYIGATGLSPDGKVMAVFGGTLVIRLLEVGTGKEVGRVPIREGLRTNQVIWSPDGKQLITAGYNGINVWDAKDGKLLRQANSPNRDGRDGMMHVSDDGRLAAVGNMYENGSVKIIDLATGSQLTAVKPAQNATVQGALSPKGEALATWGQHYNRGNMQPGEEQLVARTIQLWDVKTGKETGSLVSEIHQIQCVQFSPDGTKVAAGGNGTVQLWDAATGKLERRFAGRTGQGAQLAFSSDGKTLAAAGTDGVVQLWDVTTGKRAGLCEGPTATAVSGLRYVPDGRLLAWAVNINAIEIWEVPSGKRLTPQGGHTAAISALLFAPDGKTLTSAGQDGLMLRWDLATGKELEQVELRESAAKRRMYGTPRQVGPSYFSPNGKYLVTAGTNGGVASVWDVEAGQELFALTSAGGYVDRSGIIAFSGDSAKLVAMNRYGGRDISQPIPIWDVEGGQPLPPLKGQKGDFTCAAFSTDGSILVTGAYTYFPQGGQVAEAWAWDVGTGKVLSKVQVPNTQIHAVHFLDHRLYALFVHNNAPGGGIRVYDAVTGREVRTLEGAKGANQVVSLSQALALSPDRRLLAGSPMMYDTSDSDGRVHTPTRRVIVWEVATGSIRQEFGGLPGNVTALAFSRDGRSLAAGCSDTTIYLFDLAPKAERATALTPGDLDELWKKLDESVAKPAEEAMRTLAARPAEAVPFLKEHVRPVPGVKPDAAKISKLITDLDSGRFAVREAAMRDLERLGNLAREAVQEALKKPDLSPELRERLEKLTDAVNKPDTGAEWVRALRAVEALERIGNADAVAHLKELANGGDAPPTRAAREVLGRLGVK